MTDLEITRLCAEAMGLEITYENWPMPETDRTKKVMHVKRFLNNEYVMFNPLWNDYQAMTMVKHFRLDIGNINGRQWAVTEGPKEGESAFFDKETAVWHTSPDLNRAICECVANFQKSR